MVPIAAQQNTNTTSAREALGFVSSLVLIEVLVIGGPVVGCQCPEFEMAERGCR